MKNKIAVFALLLAGCAFETEHRDYFDWLESCKPGEKILIEKKTSGGRVIKKYQPCKKQDQDEI